MNAPRPEPLRSIAALVRRGQWQTALVALVCAGLFMSTASLFCLRQSAEHALALAAHSLAFAGEPALRFRDLEALRELAAQLAEREQLASVQVLDAAGRSVLLLQRPDRPRSGAPARWLAGLLLPEPVRAPVDGGGEPMGEVRLRTDGQALLHDVGLLTLALLGCVLLTTLTVRGVSRRLASRIARPLRQLVELTRELRVSRSFERRAAPSPVRELHALAEDFNALLAELQLQQQRIEARHHDLRRSNESLRHASLHDGLTGLPNRSHLFEHLQALFDGGQRRDDRAALLFIDVDRFKQVNDELGHAVGDAVLVELARRLRGALRESDFVARHGGDEFLAVLAPLADPAEAEHCVRRIRAALGPPMRLADGRELGLGVSIGVALYPDQGRSADGLIRAADAAMYEDKARRHRAQDARPRSA